jgi:hypothetical protein
MPILQLLVVFKSEKGRFLAAFFFLLSLLDSNQGPFD